MPAGFENMCEANDVAMHIGMRIFCGITHASLGREMDHAIKAMRRKAGFYSTAVSQIVTEKNERPSGFFGSLPQGSEAGLLQAGVVVFINAIETDN